MKLPPKPGLLFAMTTLHPLITPSLLHTLLYPQTSPVSDSASASVMFMLRTSYGLTLFGLPFSTLSSS